MKWIVDCWFILRLLAQQRADVWHGLGWCLSNAKQRQNNEKIESEEVAAPPSQLEIPNCQLLSHLFSHSRLIVWFIYGISGENLLKFLAFFPAKIHFSFYLPSQICFLWILDSVKLTKAKQRICGYKNCRKQAMIWYRSQFCHGVDWE